MKNNTSRFGYIFIFSFCLFSCSKAYVSTVSNSTNNSKNSKAVTAWEMNKRIGRGINMGSTFESPCEGCWSGYWRDDYPKIIKDKGFTSIRLPVKYDNKVGLAPEYTINKEWMDRIDHVVNLILDQNLVCILDFHHIDSLNNNPSQAHQDMFVKVWEQLSDHYKGYTENLIFELYNEPHKNMTDEILNNIYKRAYEVVRKQNPTRVIVMGGNNFNNTNDLIKDMWFPEGDKYIIGTFHRYKPNDFSHQKKGDNVQFKGTAEEIALAQDMMDEVGAWSKKNDIPVLLGEFGSVRWGGLESRVRWTQTVVEGAERNGFSMTYWCFNGGVPEGWYIYDTEKNEWIDDIINVVLKREFKNQIELKLGI